MSALSAAASDKDGDTIKALRARVASLEALLRGEPGFYITMPRAVVEQALECLEGNISYDFHGNPYEESDELMQTAAANLRVALEQPQGEQELAAEVGVIGWKNHLPNSGTVVHWTALMPPLGTKLYTHPQPPRQPLTDEQIARAWAVASGEHNASSSVKRRITRAIERAHGIGE